MKTEDYIAERHIEVATKYPNLCRLAEKDNVLEFYCDNQTLSSIRSCQGFFRESFINQLGRKVPANNIDPDRNNLDIGIWFHSVMEYIDKKSFEGIVLTTTDALFYAKQVWFEQNIEKYRDTKAYETIGGLLGALELVKDYMDFFNPANDGMKLIATELVFGYDKEAPIVDWATPDKNEATHLYRAYLVGRPDGVVETPLGIGPKDYKTSSRIEQVRDMYKPSEQIIGYTYAINKMFGASLAPLGKKCNTAYLIAVNKRMPKNPKERVVKIPYTYSDGELEAYRKRQVATFDMLYEQLVLDQASVWDTSKCCNWYYKNCPFHKLHSTMPEQREVVIESFYQHIEPWNPMTRGREEKE